MRTPRRGRTALPPRVRLGRHQRPDRLPGAPRGDRLDGRARPPWRLAGAHGSQPCARARGSRCACRGARDRPSGAGRAARRDGGTAVGRGSRRSRRRAVGRRWRRGRDPGPDRGVAGPGRAARRSPRRILIRISAQRYNEPADYERLADALVRRVGAQAGATR